MKVYKISCTSFCGSYFASYLQSVTVIAEDETDALLKLDKWFKETGREFIRPNKWAIDCVADEASGIIDWHEDSDY
jgi:heme/copper-type cytochrome/quinol oxidase subunit 2